MMTTVNDANNDKIKVLFEVRFRSVSLVRFTKLLNSMSKSVIRNRGTCKLFYVLIRYFVALIFHQYSRW